MAEWVFLNSSSQSLIPRCPLNTDESSTSALKKWITPCVATETDKGIYNLKIYRGSEANTSFKYLGVMKV